MARSCYSKSPLPAAVGGTVSSFCPPHSETNTGRASESPPAGTATMGLWAPWWRQASITEANGMLDLPYPFFPKYPGPSPNRWIDISLELKHTPTYTTRVRMLIHPQSEAC